MKIAVTSVGPGMNSGVDLRFGRCPYFVIVEAEGKKIKGSQSIENTSKDQLGSAGITAAQAVAESGAEVVITGNVGPRAFAVFEQMGIKVYQGSGTVKEAVERYLQGKLSKMGGPSGFMGAGPGTGRGMGAGRGMGTGRGMGRRRI
jgi:predicted Fe-Mo cluster-binding NifX family protein